MKAKIKSIFLNTIRIVSGKKLIVSLTSYPARYDNLHLVIDSLLKQSLRADRINLYLFEEEADELPESLLSLQSKRFRIIRVKENIRPHKKYYYAFRDFPNDIIITVDDDYIYPNDLVMNLYRKHLRYKEAVIAGRCRMIRLAKDGELLPYYTWPLYYNEDEPRIDLLATGVGGVLYLPKLLDDRVLDMNELMKLALNQDDLWLKVMEILKGTRTVTVTADWKKAKSLDYEATLFSANEKRANDECFRRLLDYYGIKESSLAN